MIFYIRMHSLDQMRRIRQGHLSHEGAPRERIKHLYSSIPLSSFNQNSTISKSKHDKRTPRAVKMSCQRPCCCCGDLIPIFRNNNNKIKYWTQLKHFAASNYSNVLSPSFLMIDDNALVCEVCLSTCRAISLVVRLSLEAVTNFEHIVRKNLKEFSRLEHEGELGKGKGFKLSGSSERKDLNAISKPQDLSIPGDDFCLSTCRAISLVVRLSLEAVTNFEHIVRKNLKEFSRLEHEGELGKGKGFKLSGSSERKDLNAISKPQDLSIPGDDCFSKFYSCFRQTVPISSISFPDRIQQCISLLIKVDTLSFSIEDAQFVFNAYSYAHSFLFRSIYGSKEARTGLTERFHFIQELQRNVIQFVLESLHLTIHYVHPRTVFRLFSHLIPSLNSAFSFEGFQYDHFQIILLEIAFSIYRYSNTDLLGWSGLTALDSKSKNRSVRIYPSSQPESYEDLSDESDTDFLMSPVFKGSIISSPSHISHSNPASVIFLKTTFHNLPNTSSSLVHRAHMLNMEIIHSLSRVPQGVCNVASNSICQSLFSSIFSKMFLRRMSSSFQYELKDRYEKLCLSILRNILSSYYSRKSLCSKMSIPSVQEIMKGFKMKNVELLDFLKVSRLSLRVWTEPLRMSDTLNSSLVLVKSRSSKLPKRFKVILLISLLEPFPLSVVIKPLLFVLLKREKEIFLEMRKIECSNWIEERKLLKLISECDEERKIPPDHLFLPSSNPEKTTPKSKNRKSKNRIPGEIDAFNKDSICYQKESLGKQLDFSPSCLESTYESAATKLPVVSIKKQTEFLSSRLVFSSLASQSDLLVTDHVPKSTSKTLFFTCSFDEADLGEVETLWITMAGRRVCGTSFGWKQYGKRKKAKNKDKDVQKKEKIEKKGNDNGILLFSRFTSSKSFDFFQEFPVFHPLNLPPSLTMPLSLSSYKYLHHAFSLKKYNIFSPSLQNTTVKLFNIFLSHAKIRYIEHEHCFFKHDQIKAPSSVFCQADIQKKFFCINYQFNTIFPFLNGHSTVNSRHKCRCSVDPSTPPVSLQLSIDCQTLPYAIPDTIIQKYVDVDGAFSLDSPSHFYSESHLEVHEPHSTEQYSTSQQDIQCSLNHRMPQLSSNMSESSNSYSLPFFSLLSHTKHHTLSDVSILSILVELVWVLEKRKARGRRKSPLSKDKEYIVVHRFMDSTIVSLGVAKVLPFNVEGVARAVEKESSFSNPLFNHGSLPLFFSDESESEVNLMNIHEEEIEYPMKPRWIIMNEDNDVILQRRRGVIQFYLQYIMHIEDEFSIDENAIVCPGLTLFSDLSTYKTLYPLILSIKRTVRRMKRREDGRKLLLSANPHKDHVQHGASPMPRYSKIENISIWEVEAPISFTNASSLHFSPVFAQFNTKDIVDRFLLPFTLGQYNTFPIPFMHPPEAFIFHSHSHASVWSVAVMIWITISSCFPLFWVKTRIVECGYGCSVESPASSPFYDWRLPFVVELMIGPAFPPLHHVPSQLRELVSSCLSANPSERPSLCEMFVSLKFLHDTPDILIRNDILDPVPRSSNPIHLTVPRLSAKLPSCFSETSIPSHLRVFLQDFFPELDQDMQYILYRFIFEETRRPNGLFYVF
ncbi:hypothetical protein ADUPG1_010802 [Aduncisulcus paluster]|uniref:Protein kinase domain-containing protein n=1 Tax=Aduncisulcus paluster TaxID=2918883 RepID=A0ABQ5JSV5_9EUKA|nr:hypothetical protein ADUPG1_010802 [Aduncisulcus paluster]